MPQWLRLMMLIGIELWALWYFARLLWVAIVTGEIIDTTRDYGTPTTRKSRPVGYWMAVCIAGVAVPGMLYLIALVAGDLLGFWQAPL